MFGIIIIVLAVAGTVLYLRMIFNSRRSIDHLRDVPDDLKRADDNQQPPFDGTAGMV